MPENTTHLQDPAEKARFTAIAEDAADAAYRRRLDLLLERHRPEGLSEEVMRRTADIPEDRWEALKTSVREAASPEEFAAFARALHVSARWLGTGSGWQQEPPQGWFLFGHHVEQAGVRLEFSFERDDALMPLWERPSDVETRPVGEPLVLREVAGVRG